MFKLKKLQELQNVVDKKIWTSADARFFPVLLLFVCVCHTINHILQISLFLSQHFTTLLTPFNQMNNAYECLCVCEIQ